MLQPSYREVINSFPEIKENHYLETLLRNFFRNYKQGEISLSLTNQVQLDEICMKGKKVKRVHFNPKVKICLLDDSACRKLLCNSKDCDPKTCTNTINTGVHEQKICLLCVSGTEANLLEKEYH